MASDLPDFHADAKANHLIHEASPYLQQHAFNPVDWYPWGEEAFRKAEEEDKPIFLSIGYASCHWCHVMERESFCNQKMAEQMNDVFVNVKVDREELPHVDALYMDCARAFLGEGGGWPLNLILTPELKPIFAATYLPVDAREGQLSLRQVTENIQLLWHSKERAELFEQADRLVAAVERQMPQGSVCETDREADEVVAGTMELLYRVIDPIYGGIEGAPKFPMGYQVNLLLRFATLKKDERALFAAKKTLDGMYQGGIYDHLGGGFSRYATDVAWQVPHFEKMLYDNAILAMSYLEGWKVTRSSVYRNVAKETLDYLATRQGEEGGFYASEDAESEGVEGGYYTWTIDEIASVLSDRECALVTLFYGLSSEGNYQGRNILYLPESFEAFAAHYDRDPVGLEDELAQAKQKLEQARGHRPHPAVDQKVVAAWQGLAIRAFAEGAEAFQSTHYLEIAEKGAEFALTHLKKGGRLVRRWCQGEAGFPPCLEDYAFLIAGLLSLFRVQGGSRWLKEAVELTNQVTLDFAHLHQGYYRAEEEEPHLLVRQIELYDGAEPSGNAVHCENLLRLAQITRADRYLEEAENILASALPFLEVHPLGGLYHVLNLLRMTDQAPVLVVALNDQQEGKEEVKKIFKESFLPHIEVVWAEPKDRGLHPLVPLVEECKPIDGKSAFYLCQEGRCDKPETELDTVVERIRQLG